MSADRILTTHAGSLPRPDDLVRMMWARHDGADSTSRRSRTRSTEAVRRGRGQQREIGIDFVSDGEMSKTGFSTYVFERLTGFDGRVEIRRRHGRLPRGRQRLFEHAGDGTS